MTSLLLPKAHDDAAGTQYGASACRPSTKSSPHQMQRTPTNERPYLRRNYTKRDGGWNQHKEVLLGWILNTHQGMIELTKGWKECEIHILDDLQKRRVRVKKWQWVLGEPQFMGATIPGPTGLFSTMHQPAGPCSLAPPPAQSSGCIPWASSSHICQRCHWTIHPFSPLYLTGNA